MSRLEGKRRRIRVTPSLVRDAMMLAALLSIPSIIVFNTIMPSFRSLDYTIEERFVWGLHTFSRGMISHQVQEGGYPPDAPSGQLPAGFGPYTHPAGEGCWGEFRYFPSFTEPTPIGGRWDVVRDALGITAAVGVHFDGVGETRGDTYMELIDAKVDDGDLATGSFRKLADGRYYLIVAENRIINDDSLAAGGS